MITILVKIYCDGQGCQSAQQYGPFSMDTATKLAKALSEKDGWRTVGTELLCSLCVKERHHGLK